MGVKRSMGNALREKKREMERQEEGWRGTDREADEGMAGET